MFDWLRSLRGLRLIPARKRRSTRPTLEHLEKLILMDASYGLLGGPEGGGLPERFVTSPSRFSSVAPEGPASSAAWTGGPLAIPGVVFGSPIVSSYYATLVTPQGADFLVPGIANAQMPHGLLSALSAADLSSLQSTSALAGGPFLVDPTVPCRANDSSLMLTAGLLQGFLQPTGSHPNIYISPVDSWDTTTVTHNADGSTTTDRVNGTSGGSDLQSYEQKTTTDATGKLLYQEISTYTSHEESDETTSADGSIVGHDTADFTVADSTYTASTAWHSRVR